MFPLNDARIMMGVMSAVYDVFLFPSGVIMFIRIIDRTCHRSASENENENKENVVLILITQPTKESRLVNTLWEDS